MKPTGSVTLATWMLEHLTFGPNREALAGDLLEELRHGRSASWYRREVASAIGIEVLTKFRNYGPRLIFSFAWSMLYPLWWLCIIKAPLAHTLFVRWATTDWPLSTSLGVVGQIVPAIAFVWLGLFIYLELFRRYYQIIENGCHSERSEEPPHFVFAFAVARSLILYAISEFALMLCAEGTHKPSALRLLASLSISLNVLLITTMGLWSHISPTGVHLSYVARENSSFHSHLIAISLPLALSLLSAISSALSHTQQRRHGTASVAS